jgi:hypothetical protein
MKQKSLRRTERVCKGCGESHCGKKRGSVRMWQESLQRTERVCEGFSKSRCGKLRGSVKDVASVAAEN